MRQATIGLAVLLLAGFSTLGAAQQEDDGKPKIVAIRVGLAGHYKVGLWTPVAITLRGGEVPQTGTVTLTVPDGDDVPSRVTTPGARPCQLLPGQETTVLLFARFGRVDGECLVEFSVDGRRVAQRTFDTYLGGSDAKPDYEPALVASRQLVVEIGPTGAGVSQAIDLLSEESEVQTVAARLTSVEDMPTRWYGYEAANAVVVSTSRPEMFDALAGGANARLEALDRWVRMGGKLVLLVGRHGAAVLDETGPLARFAPGKFAEMVPLGRTAALEAYAGGSSPMGTGNARLLVPRLEVDETLIEVREVDLPLVVRAPYGFGQVVFVAADLDRAPWNAWKDRGLLMARLLDWPSKSPGAEEAANQAIMHEGYSDLSGQLRSCLEQFTGVRVVPFGAVVAGILLYILLVGPGDYLLLRRLKRFEWTWFTFPILVVSFSVAAYFLAYWFKGDQLRTNQIDLVDVDVANGFVRGTSWANLFSPRMETYNLALRSNLPGRPTPDTPTEVLLSWLGLPREGFGGMRSQGSAMSTWRRAYEFSPLLDAMHGVPIQVWSTKSFTSRYSTHWPEAIQADLAEQDELPTGSLAHGFDFPLENCMLVYDRWVYELGTIEPNQPVRVESVQDRTQLKTLLTGMRLLRDDDAASTPYDVSSTDSAYVLRAMMFYDVAGGQRYTHLSNAYQPFVDMSHLLGRGRAILVGFAPGKEHPGAELLRDGQSLAGPEDRHVTAFRFLLPVKLPVKTDQGSAAPAAP